MQLRVHNCATATGSTDSSSLLVATPSSSATPSTGALICRMELTDMHSPTPIKRTAMEHFINLQIMYLFVLLVSMAIFCSAFNIVWMVICASSSRPCCLRIFTVLGDPQVARQRNILPIIQPRHVLDQPRRQLYPQHPHVYHPFSKPHPHQVLLKM